MNVNVNFNFNVTIVDGTMEKVTMLEFRRNAASIIRRVQKGKHLVLTRRGTPVMRLEPLNDGTVRESDPFYAITESADDAAASLTNEQMDRIVYDR